MRTIIRTAPTPGRPRAFCAATVALSLALLAGGGGSPTPARAEDAAAGAVVSLAQDTVWEGVVDVRSNTVVEKGATLLVMPGTTVRFSAGTGTDEDPGAGLRVHGTLVAQGTASAPIVFTSAAAAPKAGDWPGIIFERATERPSRLRHCLVQYAREGVRGAAALVTAESMTFRRNTIGVGAAREFAIGLLDADITENDVGIACNQGSGLQVAGSRIAGNRNAGVVCVSGSSPRIVDNEIAGNGKVGISCIQGSSPLIEGNLVSGHERGIYVELKSRPSVVRNDIVENGTGVWAEKLVFPLVADNLIARNQVGVYCNYSGYAEMHGNNFVDNARFALVLGDNQSIAVEKLIPYRSQGQYYDKAPETEFLPPQTRKFTPFAASLEGVVDARGNWWGEAATAEMAAAGEAGNVSVIEDVRDKPDTLYLGTAYPRDRVVFAPWEAAPVAAAGRPVKRYSGVSGKVVLDGKPAPGVRVHAYPDAGSAFTGEGFAYSAPAEADGSFSLPLAPGTWFLVAKLAAPPFPGREPREGELYGFYGGNPVTLGEGERREANLQVVRRREARVEAAGEPGRTTLKGTVLGPRGPVEGASVFVYADDSRNFRGPDLFGPQGAVAGGTDSTGGFEAEVPPGKYFVVAVKRAGGGTLGPLRAGDLHGWFEGNPVELAAGTTRTITVQLVEKLKDQEQQARAPRGGRAGVSGTIRDPSGAVPADVYAYATLDPNLMSGAMPPHRSLPVGADGSYFIDLPGGATYYVGARSGFGGPPLPGQWHGFFGTERPAPVVVDKETVTKGIDITVRRME